MPNAGLSRGCEELSQHKLLAAKGFFSALPRFLLFPGNRGAQSVFKARVIPPEENPEVDDDKLLQEEEPDFDVTEWPGMINGPLSGEWPF